VIAARRNVIDGAMFPLISACIEYLGCPIQDASHCRGVCLLQCQCNAGLGGSGLGFTPGSRYSDCRSCYRMQTVLLPQLSELHGVGALNQKKVVEYVVYDAAAETR